ncbi:MAG: response regulator [Alphaproteobacteria bacterium]|nr:response regulator [Alphaproteobacteria bacterium]
MPSYETVLIVDDDPITRQLLEAYAHGIGTQHVMQAADGVEAIGILDQHSGDIKLIFCDLEMPEMNGIELLGQLHARAFTGAIAIVSGAHRSIVESAAKLASLHGLNFLGRVSKPPTKATLDQLIGASGQY